jgi:hypothetical protein
MPALLELWLEQVAAADGGLSHVFGGEVSVVGDITVVCRLVCRRNSWGVEGIMIAKDDLEGGVGTSDDVGFAFIVHRDAVVRGRVEGCVTAVFVEQVFGNGEGCANIRREMVVDLGGARLLERVWVGVWKGRVRRSGVCLHVYFEIWVGTSLRWEIPTRWYHVTELG